MSVRLQTAPFDPGAELTAFTRAQKGAGAIVSFTGVVRDTEARLLRMEIEHYPGMTEAAITAFTEKATDRWALTGCLVLHRHGALEVGAPIMIGRHRRPPPRRGLRGGRVPDGLPQVPRPLLEKGSDRPRRHLGRGDRGRRGRPRQVVSPSP